MTRLQRFFALAAIAVSLLGPTLSTPCSAQDQKSELEQIGVLEKARRYEDAAVAIVGYIKKWHARSPIEAHLPLVFRMGVNLELAGKFTTAANCFEKCARWARGRSVLVNNRPLGDLALERLRTMAIAKSTGPVVVMDWTHIAGGKGAISLTPADPPKAYTDPEISLLSRRLRHPGEEEAAAKEAAGILKNAAIPFNTARREGLLFVGVGATAGECAAYSEAMMRIAPALKRLYFDTIHSEPLLQVFAVMARETDPGSFVNAPAVSLDPPTGPDQFGSAQTALRGSEEEIARKVCKALHSREMSEMEGYYQGYDNSIVLRKGLRAPGGGWYLGTAHHELVHALMSADFPRAPLWLNEGMAALYEALDGGPKGGDPIGNYRLFFLREAISEGRKGLIRKLIDTPAEKWTAQGPAFMAAAARNLCLYLYLREPGGAALSRLYRLMRDGDEGKGISAAAALERVTGLKDDALEQDFARFVMSQKMDDIDRVWGYLGNAIREYVRRMPWDPS